jgi:hypothetical protein
MRFGTADSQDARCMDGWKAPASLRTMKPRTLEGSMRVAPLTFSAIDVPGL